MLGRKSIGGFLAVLVVVGVVAIFLFSQLWLRIGLGVTLALLVIGGVLLAVYTDRKDRADAERLDQLERARAS
jgi:hypothetical protein